ncbi:MAG: hypothetical protein F4Z41_06350 [Acidimicrobiia bacterium]|nr:hypothetical protein [Acidimicrobiia bacterium]
MLESRMLGLAPAQWAWIVATLVVGLVSIWLLRGDEEPTVGVAVTTGEWRAGEAGEFVIVPAPESLAPLFATREMLSGGAVSSVALPDGVVVPAAVLVEGTLAPDDDTATLMRFPVDASLWAGPGPRAGDVAVFGRLPGGCAVLIAQLRAVDPGDVTLEVDADMVARLGGDRLEPLAIWEAPAVGWPGC